MLALTLSQNGNILYKFYRHLLPKIKNNQKFPKYFKLQCLLLLTVLIFLCSKNKKRRRRIGILIFFQNSDTLPFCLLCTIVGILQLKSSLDKTALSSNYKVSINQINLFWCVKMLNLIDYFKNIVFLDITIMFQTSPLSVSNEQAFNTCFP